MEQQVSNQEIAEHVEGIADKRTSQRVLFAALMQPSVRHMIEALDAATDEEQRSVSPTEAAFTETALRLKAAMRNAVLAVAAEDAPTATEVATESRAGRVATALFDRVLQIGRQLLTLPCLAPATAASAPDSKLIRQTFQTGDGVRIEFQQLPGGFPHRLRILIDASQIQNPAEASGQTKTNANYSVAYLTIEDSRGADGSESQPDRHVLIIPLNDQARGFADFVIGADIDAGGFPAPAGACRLVSATLSHLPQDQQGGI